MVGPLYAETASRDCLSRLSAQPFLAAQISCHSDLTTRIIRSLGMCDGRSPNTEILLS